MAPRIGKVFLDPLLCHKRAESTTEAEDQAESPQYIHGNVQVVGASRQDIRNGRECQVGRLAELKLKRYLAKQQFCRTWSEPAYSLDQKYGSDNGE